MVDYQHLADQFKTTMDRAYQRLPKLVAGVLGDGTTTKRVEVPESRIHVFFRPKLSSEVELWEVRHLVSSVPRWHGWPVLCAFNDKIGEWEVSETDVDALPSYFDSFDFRYVAEHHTQHEFNEVNKGHDAVWVYRRMIVNLRATAPEDDSLRIFVLQGDLPFEDYPRWEDGFGPNLTSYKPAAGYEKWITHYIDSTGAIGIIEGESRPPSQRYTVAPPNPPPGSVPICYIALGSEDTTVTDAMIWDARLICGTFGERELTNDQLAWLESEMDYALTRHVVNGA